MTRALLTVIFTLTFVGSPFITSPFTGFEADQLPIPQLDPPIQPAGYAFSIWGLIYAWLVVSAGFGIWKRATDPAWDVMRLPLVVSLALGTPWLWVANQSAIAATVLIIAMALPALLALHRAPSFDRRWAQTPVAIYAGWLTAASFVSIGTTLAGYGVLFDQVGWAYAGILAALAVALAVQAKTPQAPAYGATLIWALIGIVVANGLTNGVGMMATAGALVMLALLLRQQISAKA